MKKKKILIYRLGSLGDTIICLPCFHKIFDYYHDEKIYLLTVASSNNKETQVVSVLGSYFNFEQVINYPLGSRNPFILILLILKLRILGIDTIINLSESRGKFSTIRDYFFFKLAGIRNLVGFSTKQEDLTVSFDNHTQSFEWEAKRLSRRIESLGKFDLKLDHYWNLHFSKDELEVAAEALKSLENYPFLAIAPGAKVQAKDWGLHNWEQLLQTLSYSLASWRIVVIGSSDEYVLGQKCLQFWPNSLNLCGKLSPRISAAVLARAQLFIGHDSGPMHLAACVGTPCVAIFSARNLPMQWYPRGDKHSIIYHKTDCAGCGLDICVIAKKKCITSISVDEVKNEVLRMISNLYSTS